jgi:predicted O-methyltransferase YrrM
MNLKKRIRKLFRWIPAKWKARIEFAFDKSLGKEFGGPFNGQQIRQGVFRDLVKIIPFRVIVETGTFRGTTTAFMAKESGLPVFTVETEPRFFYYARLALRRLKEVRILRGDSREFIEKLSQQKLIPSQYIFFYLDAHWKKDLPLYKEIELIGANWNNAVIMIDDFEVPGDPGYKYDNYGEGKCLCLDYIAPLLENKWSVFFPAVHSSLETSIKRGCVVLASNELEDKVKSIISLRFFHPANSMVTD